MELDEPIAIRAAPLFVVEVLSQDRVQTAWEWLIGNISPRPDLVPDQCCIFDQKRWGRILPMALRYQDAATVNYLAELYIISLLGDISQIRYLSMGHEAQSIRYYLPRLEEQFRNQLSANPDAENPRDRFKRFRHSLSEHLAFWAQLAHLSELGRLFCYGISYPNFLSEDKGPDGLALFINNQNHVKVELRSVKSSVQNPGSQIASNPFRKRGVVEDEKHFKQLDEFYKVAKEGYGFRKLEAMLDNVANQIGISINQETRAGLLGSATQYNGMVVADDRHSRYRTFSCFYHVHSDPNYCIATYIGSDNWARLADRVHDCVEQMLNASGIL